MNIWRDIKTAPKHQPVLVTVEGMVCFGRFCDFEDEDYSGLAFDGACLSDGESVSYFADYIDGWQPAPVTFQPEQGFRERAERIVSELQSMMGEKMHYGEMVGAPAPYCHDGPMVYENPEDYSLEKAVDILQRMLDGDWELPEKTADEMFRALGYLWEDTPIDGGRGYEDEDGNEITVTKFGATFKPSGSNKALRINKDYIFACAQLIREMEEQK